MDKIRFTLNLQKLQATLVQLDNGMQCIAIPISVLNPFEFNGNAYFCLDAVATPNSQFGKSHFIKTVAPKGTPMEQINDKTLIVGNGKTFHNESQQPAAVVLPTPQPPAPSTPTASRLKTGDLPF